jgi:hypothetical protein
VSDDAVDAISQCDDPVVALLALDCEQKNLTAKPLNHPLWSTHMNADGLYDEFWLLAYEANFKGWLPNAGGVDFVAADANFSQLKTAGVCFYNPALNTFATSGGASTATAPGASAVPAAPVVPPISTSPGALAAPTLPATSAVLYFAKL